MKDIVINNAIKFVKAMFAEEYSGHDYWHTIRVFQTAAKLAEQEKADIFMVKLAALLHDVDDVKLSPDTTVGKDRAVSFMRENNIEEDMVCRVCLIINEISYKGTDSVIPSSIEGKCVQDADRLDAIGAIGIARAFAYGGNHNRVIYDPDIKPDLQMTEKEYRKSDSTTINHFYEKLFNLKELMNTDSARRIAEYRERFMHEYIDEFMTEWQGKR